MISRIFRIGAVCLVVTFGLSAVAQFKVAVVNPQTAIFETEVGKEVRDEWDTADKPEVDRLNAIEEEVLTLQERLRTDGDILSTVEAQDLNDQIQGKTELYQSGLQVFQQAWTRRHNAFMRDYRPRFNAVLQDLIEIEGVRLGIYLQPAKYQHLIYECKARHHQKGD